jgi:L-alanine-DL-glutamate epimerase-like enolase superfamily enzyme
MIVAVETVRVFDIPNLLFCLVHTDDGLVGLGETYYGASAVEAVVHDALAEGLLGAPTPSSAHEVTMLEADQRFYVGSVGSGAEVRARSAVDLALWDLAARARGVPLHEFVAPAAAGRVRAYNTCAGPRYMRQTTGQRSANWGLGEPSDDLWAFLHEPDRLAEDLLSEGMAAMKIWPLDLLAEQTGGRTPRPADVRAALEPLRKIRTAVGTGMDIMVEMHALWDGAAAAAILPELEEFGVAWVEDPVRMHRLADLELIRSATHVPIAGGETLGGAEAADAVATSGLIDVLITDLGWNGGIGEALRLARTTRDAGVGFALHDCSGPVVLAASTHLALTQPHVTFQETTRAYLRSWYPELVCGLPEVAGGSVAPAPGAGHGIALRDDLDGRMAVTRRLSGRLP